MAKQITNESPEDVKGNSLNINPDLNEAGRFLEILAGGQAVTFQTFSDKDDDNKKGLVRVLHGTLADLGEKLVHLNRQGAGIFVMVNEGDLKGRKTENVVRVRAWFVDLDGAPLGPVEGTPLRPHIIVETSPERYHAYWLASDGPLEDFSWVQNALTKKFGGDDIKDLPRVMRVPGFYHLKGEPFRSRIIYTNDGPACSLKTFVSCLDIEPDTDHQVTGRNRRTPATEDVIPDGKRNLSLASLAGTMRRQGMTEEEMNAALQVANANRCDGALPTAEVSAIAESISRYDPTPAYAFRIDDALPLLDQIIARAKEKPLSVLEREAVAVLAIIQRDAPVEWRKVKEVLKGKGVQQDLDRAIRQHRKQHLRLVRSGDEEAGITAGELFPDAPLPDLLIPPPYSLNREAIVYHGETGEKVIAYAPVLITERFRDLDEGTIHLKLAWYEGGRWQHVIQERGAVLEDNRLVRIANCGFPCASDNKRDVVKYLHQLEAANLERIPEARLSSHMGWQGKDGKEGFLWGRTLLKAPPDSKPSEGPDAQPKTESEKREISFRGLDVGDEQIAGGFHAQGTPEGWKEAIAGIEKQPRALFVLYGSFVPPLLGIVGAPNFVIDLSGRTSTGKTTALRLAASVWGNPDERCTDTVLHTWDGTKVWFERASYVLSDLPLILDDTKRAKNRFVVEDLIYKATSGKGRGRGNKKSLSATRTWHTVVLSSGEAPLFGFTEAGGARARCVTIRGLIFGAQDDLSREFVDRLNPGIEANYGHAGPSYVEFIQSPEIRDEIRKHYAESLQKYTGQASGPMARLAKYFAAIETAALYAHKAVGIPFESTVFVQLWSEVSEEMKDASPEERALKDMVSWAYSNRESFMNPETQDDYYGPDRCSGFWRPGGGWSFIAFYPTVMRKQLKELGYVPEEILYAWRERGWIETEGKQRYTKQMRLWKGQERVWVIVIPSRVIEEQQA